jgi:hypothetical protein
MLPAMFALLSALLGLPRAALRSRRDLVLENLLRHRQNRRQPRQCHRTTVSGQTSTRCRRQSHRVTPVAQEETLGYQGAADAETGAEEGDERAQTLEHARYDAAPSGFAAPRRLFHPERVSPQVRAL